MTRVLLSGVKGARSSYSAMKSRCGNPKDTAYPYYGGRGIKVCARWLGEGGFRRFLEDMGERPAGTTIDRINNARGYEPGNCRWANAPTQAANKRQRSREALLRQTDGLQRNYARIALSGYTRRLLGFRRTERLMSEIREALEEAFGPPRNEEAPTSLFSIEEAFLTHDYSRDSYHFEGLEWLAGSIRVAQKPLWLQTNRKRGLRARKAA